MPFEQVIFLAFIFLKQFYLFPSGSAGIGDMAFAACFCIMLVKSFRKKQPLLDRGDYLLYLFLGAVIAVNGVYFFIYRDGEFIRNTLFWAYSVMIVWCFRRLKGDNRFGLWLNRVLKLSLLLQLALWILGLGRLWYEYWGGTRYMGTFNNPNQMAYFVFLAMLLLCAYDIENRRRGMYFYIPAAGVLIISTMSTGVFLGWLIFAGALALQAAARRFSRRERPVPVKVKILAVLLAAGAAGVALAVIWPGAGFAVAETDYGLLVRVQEKIYKLWNGGLLGIIYDRGWEKLLLYPRCLLFGGGEGMYERFSLAVWKSEIHSTVLSIWFCYGAVPLGVIGAWLYKNLKGMRREMIPVYAALLIECLTVINYRQPMFWMLLVYGMAGAGCRAREEGRLSPGKG